MLGLTLDRILVFLAVVSMQLQYSLDGFIPRIICYVVFYTVVFCLIDRIKEGK